MKFESIKDGLSAVGSIEDLIQCGPGHYHELPIGNALPRNQGSEQETYIVDPFTMEYPGGGVREPAGRCIG